MASGVVSTSQLNNSTGATPMVRTDNIGFVRLQDGTLTLDQLVQMPALLKTVIPTFDFRGMLNKIEFTKKVERVRTNSFQHYESGLPYSSFRIASYVATGSTAQAAKFKITTSSYSGDGATIPYRPYLQESNVFRLPNGEDVRVDANGVTGTGNDLTFTAYRSTASTTDLTTYLPSIISGGTSVPLMIVTRLYAEASAPPKTGTMSEPTRYVGTFGIFREGINLSGSVSGNYLQLTDPETGTPQVFDKARTEQELIHRMNVWMDLFIGSGKAFLSSEGVIRNADSYEQLVRQRGLVYRIENAATLADFDAIAAYMVQNNGAMEYSLPVGFKLNAELNRLFRAELANTQARYGQDGPGGPNDTVNFGFQNFISSGFAFRKVLEPAFTMKDKTALPTYNYTGMGIAIPDGTERVRSQNQGMDQMIDVPNFTLMVKDDLDGNPRQYQTHVRRGLDTDGYDRNSAEVITEMGGRGAGLNKSVILDFVTGV